MRKILFAILFALPFLAQAQTKSPTQKVDYALTGVKDSFYLDEVVTTLDTNGVEVGVTKSSQLFRSKDQLSNYVGYLHSQAKQLKTDAETIKQQAAIKAQKIMDDAIDQAKKMVEASPKIESAAQKIDAVARKSEDLFSGKIPDQAPTKPKKKKTKN